MTIIEKLMPQHYFANGLAAAQADQVSYYYSYLKDFNVMKDNPFAACIRHGYRQICVHHMYLSMAL